MPPAARLDPDLINISRMPMHPRDFQWTASLAIPALSNHHVLSTVRSWALEIPMSRYGMTPWTNVYKTWGIDVITLRYVDTKWYKTTWIGLKVLVIWPHESIKMSWGVSHESQAVLVGHAHHMIALSLYLREGFKKGVFQVWKKNGVFFQSRPFPAVTISRFLTCHMKYKTKSPLI